MTVPVVVATGYLIRVPLSISLALGTVIRANYHIMGVVGRTRSIVVSTQFKS